MMHLLDHVLILLMDRLIDMRLVGDWSLVWPLVIGLVIVIDVDNRFKFSRILDSLNSDCDEKVESLLN